MPGLEIVVRPVIFPNIRPQSPRVLPPEDDPLQGIATIGGQGGGLIELQYTGSTSASSSGVKEEKREVDEARIYQQDKNTGQINKKNYLEADILRGLWLTGDDLRAEKRWRERYSAGEQKANIEILRRGVQKIADIDDQ